MTGIAGRNLAEHLHAPGGWDRPRAGPPPEPAPTGVPTIAVDLRDDVDTGGKLEGYFRLAGVRPYLIVKSDRHAIIHHRHGDDGSLTTRIITRGTVELDPPGIALELDRLHA